jgi:hypothetical protein
MDYNIDQFLQDLEIEPINPGMCNGTKYHITAGELLDELKIRKLNVGDYLPGSNFA